MRLLTAFLAFILATPALAQSYPSPIFSKIIVNDAVSVGGNLSVTGAATITGSLSTSGVASLGSLTVLGYSTLQGVTMLSPVISDCAGYAYGNAATQITCSSTVPVADITAIAANTLVANATASSAAPTAVSIPSCSSTGQALNYMSGSGFTCAAAATRDIGGRLTLTQGSPIMTGNVTNASELYYTPYASDYVVLWDGSNLQLKSFTELTMSTTDATKNPASVGASACYDAFVWNDAGTLRLSHGPAWTNCTTRGYTFTQHGAFFFNTSAITNGPGAGLGLWVGSFFSNSSSKLEWLVGGSGSGGVAASLGVWNQYNRVNVTAQVWDWDGWWRNDSSGWRSAHGSTNNRVTVITGAADTQVDSRYESWFYGYNDATGGRLDGYVGVCVDCTNNASGPYGYFWNSDQITSSAATWVGFNFGKHFIQATERAGQSQTQHYFGNGILTFKAEM